MAPSRNSVVLLVVLLGLRRNKGAMALFGYSAEEALGRPVESLILPDDASARAERNDELARRATEGQ